MRGLTARASILFVSLMLSGCVNIQSSIPLCMAITDYTPEIKQQWKAELSAPPSKPTLERITDDYIGVIKANEKCKEMATAIKAESQKLSWPGKMFGF